MFGCGDVLEYDDFYWLMRARGKKEVLSYY